MTLPPPRSYTWTGPAGTEKRLDDVASLIFEPGHVTFYDAMDRLLLAERNEDVRRLRRIMPEASGG